MLERESGGGIDGDQIFKRRPAAVHFGIKMLHLEDFCHLAALAFATPRSDGALLHFGFQEMAMANSEFLHHALGDANRVVLLNRKS